jgi:large subunit ribosomal protein L17
MFRALTANLVAHERIETTDAKAKELRRVAERLITKAIRLGAVAYTPHAELSIADRARRQAAQQQVGGFLRRFQVTESGGESTKVDLIEKVFVDLAKRFKSRPGGNAPMSMIEFVDKGEPRAVAAPKSDAEKAPKAKAEAGEKAAKPKKAAKAAAAG